MNNNIKNFIQFLLSSDHPRRRVYVSLALLVVAFIAIIASAYLLRHGERPSAQNENLTDTQVPQEEVLSDIDNNPLGQDKKTSDSQSKKESEAKLSAPSSNPSSQKSQSNSNTPSQSTGGGNTGSSGGTTTPPPPYTPQSLFVGNFETGNFSQWSTCQNIVYNSNCSGYNGAHYSLTVQSTIKRQGNWAARFEVRNGDQPFCCGERSEIHGGNALTSVEGQERWYQWATYFGAGFPTTQGWSAVAQWHADADGSPPLAFHSSDDGLSNGYFGLIERRYASPSQLLSSNLIWQVPENPGTWHDIKLHVKWSTSDASSLIELWHNGVKQTFSGACAGLTQCKLRTMMPGGGNVYFKQGYYRDPNYTITGVVYHDGFSMAATEADLSPL